MDNALFNAEKGFRKITSSVLAATSFAQKGAEKIGSTVGETAFEVADTLGFKSTIQAAEIAAKRAVKDGGKKLADANKAMNKARRIAKRALDLEEEDDALTSSDYELLLSAAGATEKNISINSNYTQTYAVPAGSTFVWKARVKKYDIGFSLKELRDDGSMVDIEPLNKYRSDNPIQGQLSAANYARKVILLFDNTHSHIQAKRFVYWTACGENVSLADDAAGAVRSLEVAAAEEGPAE